MMVMVIITTSPALRNKVENRKPAGYFQKGRFQSLIEKRQSDPSHPSWIKGSPSSYSSS
jgi:hypothetical protein